MAENHSDTGWRFGPFSPTCNCFLCLISVNMHASVGEGAASGVRKNFGGLFSLGGKL